MSGATEAIIERIRRVRPLLHGAGPLSSEALLALAEYARSRRIRRSVETGCGASTLLLSHLSDSHTVFSLDIGGSLTSVRQSELLRRDSVEFVEGPTKLTLPAYQFHEPIQLALLDGPHSYPMPDLEYCYLLPHLEPAALLVLDDIQIRTIHNLFAFLRQSRLFRLDKVVGTTAFFTRTHVPPQDPLKDEWRLQTYNRRILWRYAWKGCGQRMLPLRFVRSVARLARTFQGVRTHCGVRITSSRLCDADRVSIEGVADLTSSHQHLWVLAHRSDLQDWWPQGAGEVAVIDGKWQATARLGEPRDAGCRFELAALVVTDLIHDLWANWMRRAPSCPSPPPILLPPAAEVFAEAYDAVVKPVH
jgi:hypothetical protein